jgi:hypothetical protein
MATEDDKIFFENLMQRSIKLEKELCNYIANGTFAGSVERMVKLTSITNDFNKIAIKLHHIKEGNYEDIQMD